MNLYLDRDRIVDDSKRVYTIDEARKLWNSGQVSDYNLSLGRLAQFGWDLDKLRTYYEECDRARRPAS